MKEQSIRQLAQAVQRNCHISDARHSGDYSLCVYLMKMREYFRWEMKLPYGTALVKDQVGSWLQAREQMWEELEEAELAVIEIEGERFFDLDGDPDRPLTRPQMELVAARTSWLNECFY